MKPDAVLELFSQIVTPMWMIICGILVFFMQAGFTLVEVGFTRSKNAGNIIMKNIMDFVAGSIGFWVIGYSLMYGDDIASFIGSPKLFFNDDTLYYDLFFQTVFAATAATIVSGAIAERTKFTTYLIFSVIISVVIYPISGHWGWSANGWLTKMGYTDLAGSSIVHSVGGWASLVAAAMVGPRIGKYKDGVSQAIPGHNLLVGALGVFILWFCWYGFNGGSSLSFDTPEDVTMVGTILINTTLAASVGALSAMLYTWMRYGNPDISMTLNGALAGLVAVTAGCAAITPGSAAIIGLIAGIMVVVSITFIDEKLKIDDPVGAISVHGVCGSLGTILVGVFAIDGGLINGGGFDKLIVQTTGVAAYAAWAIACTFVVFFILKNTIGLRVSEKEEIEGLDKHEHGVGVYNE